MKRVYISGVSGFVGQNLWGYLKLKPFELHSISLRETINTNIVTDADVVVHLAGKAHDLKNVSDPAGYYSVNFELTKKIYDLFLISEASVFIFISSVKASADHTEIPLTESHIPSPITDYGKSKRMAEEYIEQCPLPEGKSYYILRPCMIHGPGNKGNLNLLYNFIRRNIPYPLGDFQNMRSFLSIDNLNFVIERLINGPLIPSGIYHVADRDPLDTNDLIREIGNAIGTRPRIWKINKALIRSIAKVNDILRLPFNSDRLQKLTESYVVSSHKLQKALGSSLPVNTKDGIKKTILSFKQS